MTCVIFFILNSTNAVNAQAIPQPDDQTDSSRRFGALIETYSYGQLIYDRIGIGGYFGAVTYRVLPSSTLGLGYDYSVYNHSVLLDIRQEISRMRLRPVLMAGFGYAFAGTNQTITSSFGLQKEIVSKPGLVYRIGGGLRAYFSKTWPVALNVGLFYKSEPGYSVTETKSGSIIVNAYQNVGSFCLSIGLSY